MEDWNLYALLMGTSNDVGTLEYSSTYLQTHDLEIPFLGMLPQEMKLMATLNKILHMNSHNNIILNSPNVDITPEVYRLMHE